VNVGILGLALSHPYSFAKLFPAYGVTITHVWDDDTAKAGAFAAEYGGKVVSSPEAMVDQRLDAVFVTSRAVDHCRHARPLVEAGTPVYVDKPLALDAAEAAELIAFVRARDAVFMSCSQQRYQPAFRALGERLRDGAAGHLVSLHVLAGHDIRHYIDTGNYQDDPDVGGGTLINMGIHGVEPLVALVSVTGHRPRWVQCRTSRTIHRDTRSEDVATLHVGFEGDVLASTTILGSAQVPGGYAADLYGTAATLTARTPDLLADWKRGPIPVGPLPPARNAMLERFFESIRTRRPAIPLEETLDVIRILVAARQSACDGGAAVELT
jgi:predicted dehydrogenase